MAITTKHQLLAWDLVEGLGDEKHKGIYFRLAKVYQESFLREALSLTRAAYNEGKIKSEDRGRYFMGIIKKERRALDSKTTSKSKKIYAKNTKNNPRRRAGLKRKGKAGGKS